MKIRALSASDRNNYGDLLFPLILKKYLSRKTSKSTFDNYGIIESDLTNFGALKTKSFKRLNRDIKMDKEESTLVIAGGEVLGGNWLNIYRFVSTFYNYIYHNKYLHSLFLKTKILEKTNYITRSSSVPFVLDGPNFSNTKIVYNSVGANGVYKILYKRRYIKYFNNIENLSVRDKKSQLHFSQVGIESKLVPDSAILMSDFFCDELENVSLECKKFQERRYVFLQLGNKKGPDDIKSFVENVKSFADRHSLEVVLCPIGLAMDHSDDKLLKKIHSKYSDIFSYYDPKNLYEIMFLLKNSNLYLGTSLHGFITAQSFNVPFFVFTQKIQKLKYYLDSWFDNSAEKYGSFSDFDKVEKLFTNFDYELEQGRTERHKELVRQNISKFLL